MGKTVSNGGPALVFYYDRLNRYSFNALAGALDGNPGLSDLPIRLPKTAEELVSAAAALRKRPNDIIIALSILTCQFPATADLVRRLRSMHAGHVTIIAGGAHASADARHVLHSGIDIVFRGESEVTFPAVLSRLMQGEDFRDFRDTPGISFRDGDQVITGLPPAPVDIESFWSFSPRRGMLGPIEITRGCPFACSFCQTSHIFGIRPRHRSVAAIARQAAALPRDRKVVRLLSPNAFSYGSPDGRELNLPAIRELLAAVREAVSPRGRIVFGHFPSEVRPEHVTPETLELVREFADNDEIVIGAQSGSPRMLEACRRAHGIDSVISAVSLARKSGYKVIVDFMFGLPGETPRDVSDSVAVMTELAQLGGVRIHPHEFAPLPQTPFSAERPGSFSAEAIDALRRLERRRAVYGSC